MKDPNHATAIFNFLFGTFKWSGGERRKKELFTYKQTIVINYCVQTFIISTGEWTTFSHAAALCVHVVTVVVP